MLRSTGVIKKMAPFIDTLIQFVITALLTGNYAYTLNIVPDNRVL